MRILDTKHKQKSAVVTSVILILILIGVFNYGMTYFDPPIEYGISISLGDSEIGGGNPAENSQKIAKSTKPSQVVEETKTAPSQEPIITQDNEETLSFSKEKQASKKPQTKKNTETDKNKPTESKQPTKTSTPSKAATDALNSLLKQSSDTKKSTAGKGDDSEQSAIKGIKQGDANSSNYYAKGGNGSGGNYQLAGRKALSKPIKKPNCQEEGVVVVSVYVNQSGSVIKAVAGAKGTTNSAPCLFKAATKAALQTKWNPDSKAPATQKGVIIYQFSLSE